MGRSSCSRTSTDLLGGISSYTGAIAIYSCITDFESEDGYQVILREGRSTPAGSPFGYLRALIDHNLDEGSIGGTIASVVAGTSQGNRRYSCAAFEGPDGTIKGITFIEDRVASSNAKDNDALGVLAGYCHEGPPTTDQSTSTMCPDWVNGEGGLGDQP